VLLEDECHLRWGAVCGHVWGKRNQPIAVAMTNPRQGQTYYGSLNLLTQPFVRIGRGIGARKGVQVLV
jgi:hypothetical protein